MTVTRRNLRLTPLQDIAKHQKLISHVLGVPMHKLVSKTKRLGGGFGGKETRGAFLHCTVAVASFHSRRAVRLVLDRQEDMQMTGHRHAFLGKYRVAYAADGRILGLDLDLFNNAGVRPRGSAIAPYSDCAPQRLRPTPRSYNS